jgi:hypothetical protein
MNADEARSELRIKIGSRQAKRGSHICEGNVKKKGGGFRPPVFTPRHLFHLVLCRIDTGLLSFWRNVQRVWRYCLYLEIYGITVNEQTWWILYLLTAPFILYPSTIKHVAPVCDTFFLQCECFLGRSRWSGVSFAGWFFIFASEGTWK